MVSSLLEAAGKKSDASLLPAPGAKSLWGGLRASGKAAVTCESRFGSIWGLGSSGKVQWMGGRS
eukprot:568401-Rhodomonas_salina.1